MIIGDETKAESLERTRLAAEYLLRIYLLEDAISEAQAALDHCMEKNDADGIAAFTDILTYLKGVESGAIFEGSACTWTGDGPNVT